ncbi:MAG: Gfo/Idh/MocA family oxidoreductase [Candidatus Hinthialibacter sp.]
MTKSDQVSRRSFLKKGGGAGMAAMTAPMIVSSKVFGANDVIGMGVIGPGRRGAQLMGDFSRLPGNQFVAVSDFNSRRLDQVAAGKDWKKCKDFRELLELKEVDAVIVATPDHWHALCSIYANMAGKDVYVEKPMTLTVAEGRAMTEAARKYKCIVQCGSQQRSDAKSRIGCELVRNEVIGKIKTVHAANYPSPWDQPFPTQPVPDGVDWDMWIGPAPFRGYHKDIIIPRAQPGWISIVDFSGGEVTGWGAHGIDMIQWALGMENTGPVKIWTEGNPRELDRVVNMQYENGIVVRTDNQGPQGGAKFDGEKGSIVVDRGYFKVDPPELAKEECKIKLPVSRNHQQNFLDCVRSRELPIADVEAAHRSTTMCHFINIARWVHRELHWDPAKEQFIDDKDANTYLDRPRRKPWELPKI